MSERVIVLVGNASAIELQRRIDAATGEESAVFVTVPGERITTINLEPGLPLMDRMQQVVRFLQEMMAPDGRPWWFETGDDALRVALIDHYGLAPGSTRPPQWGDGTTTAPKAEKKKPKGTTESTDQTLEGDSE